MHKLPLSVSIISYNEEANIARCLDSVQDIASEIVIVDSHSSDNTSAICQNYGVQFYDEDWKGHVAQKNSALDKCTFPWIFSLDCDEEVTPELKKSLIHAITSPECDGYYIKRKTFYMGKLVQYSWSDDWNLRLIKNGGGKWVGYDPHDRLEIKGSTGNLQGDLLHHSYKNLRDQYLKTISYASIGAESYLKDGKKAGLINLVINPFHSFLKHFIFKLGFLDGVQGFFIAVNTSIYTYLKYAFILEKQNK